MCGRFTLSHREARALAAEMGVSVESLLGYKPRYNIAPTDSHWIVRNRFEDREVLPEPPNIAVEASASQAEWS